MTQKSNAKKGNRTEVKVKDEEKVIKSMFRRPLEALRIMYLMDGEPRAEISKKVASALGIKRGTANDHVKVLLESNFFTYEEDGKLYQNETAIKWLWSYLLPLYPMQEGEALETMLFSKSIKFNKMELAKTLVYTKRIEDAIKDDFEHEIDSKTLKKIVNLVWNVFGDEKIKTDLY